MEDGQGRLTDYDIIERAGAPATAIVESFGGINVADGNLTIAFTTIKNYAKISGIEVLAENVPPNQGEVPDYVEFQALVDLYNSTEGDNWYDNSNWLQGTTYMDFEQWYGVTTRGGDVTEINLYKNNLSGPIRESIGDLARLQQIVFQNNYITGGSPKAWAA